MRTRKNRLLIAIGCAIILVILFQSSGLLSLRQLGESTWSKIARNPPFSNTNARKRSMTAREGPKIKDIRLKSLYNSSDHVAPLVSPSEIDGYFNVVGRNVKSITQVFWLTRDAAYLHELRKYPDSAVALRLLAQFGTDPKQALADAERIRILLPDDPIGPYLASFQQSALGDHATALATLGDALSMPGGLTNDTIGQKDDSLAALKVMGYDDVEAQVYLMTHPTQYVSSYQDALTYIDRLLSASNDDEDAQAATASKLLDFCARISPSKESVPEARLMLYKGEMKVLKKLPSDFEYGDSSTVSGRLEELKKMYSIEWDLANRSGQALLGAEPEAVDAYFKKVNEEGQLQAREWLLNR